MLRLCALIMTLLCAATSAVAQHVPTVSSASTDILVVGQTQELTLSGDHLTGATRVLVIGEGGVEATLPRPPAVNLTCPVSAKPVKPEHTLAYEGDTIAFCCENCPKAFEKEPKKFADKIKADAPRPDKAPDPRQLKLQVTVKPEAPRGPRELRVVTDKGVSKPLRVTVDDYPAVNDKEPNDSLTEAQSITLPSILVGSIHSATQADLYRFPARKGQRLIFEVIASRSGSKLDASLYLYGPQANQVARDLDTNGLDPLIDYTVPEDGAYTLKIQDLQYRGGAGYDYRIRAGEIPYVDAIFPLGGKRGQLVSLELVGRNLPSPKMDMMLDDGSPMGRRQVTAPTPRGVSNPRSFEVSDLPELMESEPNGPGDKPNPAATPIVVNGRIGQAGDTDRFVVKVPATQPIVAEVFASRYGSPLDTLLTLTDAKGAVLQRNDDITAAPGQPSGGADARIQFEARANTEYVLSITDLLARGGSNYAYRVQIAPPARDEPDFEVLFKPEDALRVARGSNTRLWCQVKRKSGFDGDVVVALVDTPPGVTCEPLLLRSNVSSSGLMLISAAEDATLGTTPLQLIATGRNTRTGRVLTRQLTPRGVSKAAPELYLTVLDKPPFAIARLGDPAGANPEQVAAEIAELRRKLETATPQLEAAQAKWEADTIAKGDWQPLEVVKILSRYGSKITRHADGAILAEGPNPGNEVYNIILRTKLKRVTALKLEAIADEGKGPGRADDGNFVLTHFQVVAAPADVESKRSSIDLVKARADFVQAGFDVNQTLNTREEHQNGWAVHPQTAQSHWAAWDLQHPVENAAGTTLDITLTHLYAGGRFTLRKFRVMVSDRPNPKGAFSLPDNLLAVLYTPSEQRSDEQRKQIATYYRSVAPELKDARERLAHLQARSAPFPPVITGNADTNLLVSVQRNGYEGDITLSLEGFSAGIESKANPANPALKIDDMPPLAKNLDASPVVLKGKQTDAVLPIKTSSKTDRATRTVVVRAEATVNGTPYVQYSDLIPLTVKDPPK
jgi:YHS domain-containing protein